MSNIEKVFGGDDKEINCRESNFGNKKVICNKRERKRPFNIDAVPRVLYHQQCLEEYQADIENNVEFYANIISTISFHISLQYFLDFLMGTFVIYIYKMFYVLCLF